MQNFVVTHVSGRRGRYREIYHHFRGLSHSDFRSQIVDVVVLPGVERIDMCKFRGWIFLESVTLPEGVTHIGEVAFAGCWSLHSISLPMSLTTIGPLAFVDCTSLASIKIPKGVTAIGDRTFDPCTVPIFF